MGLQDHNEARRAVTDATTDWLKEGEQNQLTISKPLIGWFAEKALMKNVFTFADQKMVALTGNQLL